MFFISNPPTWLPVIAPPELLQLIGRILVVKVEAVVVVVTLIEPLELLDPIMFPSPGAGPPMATPEPAVSIPTNATKPDAVGTEEMAMFATVFPLIVVTGTAPDVVTRIPWKETFPSVDP